MVFTAGQKVRALELNRGVPNLVRATADTSVVSSTTLVNATGLVQAVEASVAYWWRLLLLMDSAATPDGKIGWTVPSGAAGRWGIAGQSAGLTAYGGSNTLFIDGANNLAVVEGYLLTSATAGSLQLQFAQNTSNGTPAAVKAGSSLSLARLP